MQRLATSVAHISQLVRCEASCSGVALQWFHQGWPCSLITAPFSTMMNRSTPGVQASPTQQALAQRNTTALSGALLAMMHTSISTRDALSSSAPSAPQDASTSAPSDAGSTSTAASAPASNSGRSSATAAGASSSKEEPPRRSSVSYGARIVQPWRTGGPQITFQEGIVHINNGFNNCIISLTDMKGNVKAWTSCGTVGFKNAAKSKPLAAEKAAEELARKAIKMGFTDVTVRLKGMGRNKQHAVTSLNRAGLRIKQLQEITPVPYNGCRLPRKRRV